MFLPALLDALKVGIHSGRKLDEGTGVGPSREHSQLNQYQNNKEPALHTPKDLAYLVFLNKDTGIPT